MAGTWAGTYTIELAGASPYQAKNGVRGVVDLTAGDVTVNSPAVGNDSATFSIWWHNPNRNTLTINSPANIQDVGGNVVASLTTTLLDGVLGFVWSGSEWIISDFNAFDVPLGIVAGVTFTPRGTNGLCTLDDAFHVASVDRTAEGNYLVTSDGTDISDMVISVPQPYAIGLAADQKGEAHVAGKTTTTVELVTGRRNNGGVWQDDDLDQNAANRISLFVVRLA
jgi:hypothetical protein